MTTIHRTLHWAVGLSVLATAAGVPVVANAEDIDGFVLQPIPPQPADPEASAPSDVPKTADSKMDAMDPPRLWEKKPTEPTAPPFRDTEFGSHPHFGQPHDGGRGYRHYSLPAYRYDIWYRPRGFGMGIAERCSPAPFRPKGYGNLFNEPSTCYRMDYSRYALKNYATDYGPSYYRRQPDQRCPDYDKSDRYRPACDPSRLRRIGKRRTGQQRRTKVWTLSKHHRHGDD